MFLRSAYESGTVSGRERPETRALNLLCRLRRPFGLPEVAALVCCVQTKARPDAIANACVQGRSDLDFVDRNAPGCLEHRYNPALPVQEGGQNGFRRRGAGRLDATGRRKSKLRWRLKGPHQYSSPEIQ